MKLSALALLAILSVASSAPTALQPRTPPNVPSASAAISMLASLSTRTVDATGYDRALFPHWITQSGACDTREVVLKRDGTNVVQASSCAATSGTWFSPYDGATWTASADVDIDHMVPLSDAWKSGAGLWTTAKRQSFANDLTNPQLLAVTDNVNQSKGDKSPDAWKPSVAAYHCTYARMWVKVKSVWALSVTAPERSALVGMLATC